MGKILKQLSNMKMDINVKIVTIEHEINKSTHFNELKQLLCMRENMFGQIVKINKKIMRIVYGTQMFL